MKLCYAAYSTVGAVRPINEDNIYLNGISKAKNQANFVCKGKSSEERQLFAVLDGLGGEENGEVAACIGANHLKQYQKSFAEDYADYLREANHMICGDPDTKGTSGCTVAALAFTGRRAMTVNLGDSRIYLFREESLTQLTHDHTEYTSLLEYGVLTEEDYYTSPARNHLTRHLGNTSADAQMEPFCTREILCRPGDLFLLCSDGLCGSLRLEKLKKMMTGRGSLLRTCMRMGQAAQADGSDDNITAALILVQEI